METPQKIGYGYVADNDESLKSKSGGKFGGNFGSCFLTNFKYNPNISKESSDEVRPAIEVTVKVADREYKTWINPVTQVSVNNVMTTDLTSPEAIKEFNKAITQQNAVVTHYLKAVGVSPESLKNALMNGFSSFEEYAQKVCSLLPVGFDKKPLDVFLEYQWNFGKKQDGSLNDKTYPTLPKNMLGGYFIVPAQAGVFNPVIAEDGSLSYVNNVGVAHPFERDSSFMTGKKGTQQVLGQSSSESAMSSGIPTPAAPTESSW
jgi:hypothetical protein